MRKMSTWLCHIFTRSARRAETGRPSAQKEDGFKHVSRGGEASLTVEVGGGSIGLRSDPLLPVTSSHKHMEPLSRRQGKCIYLLFRSALTRAPHFAILYATAQCDTGRGNSIPHLVANKIT